MDAQIQYPYAYDENKNLVYIGNVAVENRYDHTYHCPNCGANMIPRLGENNQHCFAHAENQECSGESYIHKAAKLLLAKRFNERSMPFKIGLTSARPCIKLGTCQERTDNFQLPPKYEEINLLDSYDLPAVVEVNILEPDGEKKFTPDAMLRSSDPKLDDIFIEVYYKHKVPKDKIESGHKIIEIRVRELADLKTLKESECFKESKDIVFYNFEPKKVKPEEIEAGIRHYLGECSHWKVDRALPPCKQSLETKRRNSHLRRLTLFKSGSYFNDGIFKDERGTHRTSALMDITYESEIGISNLVLLGVMSKYDIRARICALCDYCTSKYDSTNTWCKLVKNGSSKKGTFNPFKGNYCHFFEWNKSLDLEQLIDSFDKETEKYNIWISPQWKINH